MTREIWLAALLLCIVMAGCQSGLTGEDPAEGPFTVTVLKSSGEPLEGAVIEGGLDWDAFEVTTDSTGHASLPDHARGVKAVIHLDNYFPLPVTLKEPFRYSLTPTPKRLRLLGNVEGSVARFSPGRLATVDYHGKYHLYAFDEGGLAEIASAEVPRTVKQIELSGDTLWLSTHEDGVFACSLADPEHPVEVLHLDIPGCTSLFALRDHLIVVGDYGNVLPLGVYLFAADGTFEETARFGDFYVSSIVFVEGYLVVTGYRDAHPRVYALDDPSHPVLVYDGADPRYWSGFSYGNQYIQIPEWVDITENAVFGWLDLTNPAAPRPAGLVRADSLLISLIDDATAIGYYYTLGNALSVLKGNLVAGFRTAAVISEHPHYDLNEFGGCAPPFFVISNRLWVLEERTDLTVLYPPARSF